MARKTLVDKMLQWAGGDVGLEDFGFTDREKQQYERWKAIDGLLREHQPNLSVKAIAKIIINKFGISERQFFIDYKDTQAFFGKSIARNKDYLIQLRVEHLRRLAEKAERVGDFKAAVLAIKEANKLDGLYDADNPFDSDDFLQSVYQLPVVFIDGDGNITQTQFNLDELNKLPQQQQEQIYNAVIGKRPTPEQITKMIEKEREGGDN